MADYTPFNLQSSSAEKSYWARIMVKKVLVYIVCIFLTLLSVVPFIIMFMGATKNSTEIGSSVLSWWVEFDNKFIASMLPSSNFINNWNYLFDPARDLPIFQGFLNSAIISICSTALAVYFSTLTAYGFTAYRFRGNKLLYGFILTIMMVPTQVSTMGFVEFMRAIGWGDNYLALIVPAIAAPSTIFFMRQYMASSLSLELVEAGRMDGCTEFGIFNRLVLPILTPGMATMAIFGMVTSWNQLFMPMILLTTKEKFTIPIVVSLLSAAKYRTEFGAIYLGLSLTALPLIVFYLLLSKYIIAGVALGGVKE